MCRDLLTQAVERGEPLGRTENTLTDLLAQYCGAELTVAIADALARIFHETAADVETGMRNG